MADKNDIDPVFLEQRQQPPREILLVRVRARGDNGVVKQDGHEFHVLRDAPQLLLQPGMLVRARPDASVAVEQKELDGPLADGVPALVAGKPEVLEVQLGVSLVVPEQGIETGGLENRGDDLVEDGPFALDPPVVDLVPRREDGPGAEGQDVPDDLPVHVVLGPGVAVDDEGLPRLGGRLGGDGEKERAKRCEKDPGGFQVTASSSHMRHRPSGLNITMGLGQSTEILTRPPEDPPIFLGAVPV